MILNEVYHGAAIDEATTILEPCHEGKSLQLIWRLCMVVFKWVAVTLLDLSIGQHDSSHSNGCQVTCPMGLLPDT